MREEQESHWIQNARNYLNTNTNNHDGLWDTVNYLVTNHNFGINNRTSIEVILGYLASVGIELSREAFQQRVLGELKRQEIVATLIYPGPRGGVFIPINEIEIIEVIRQGFSRIHSEAVNLEGVTQSTRFGRLFELLRTIVEWIQNQIQ